MDNLPFTTKGTKRHKEFGEFGGQFTHFQGDQEGVFGLATALSPRRDILSL
jgi:hypothetical protein